MVLILYRQTISSILLAFGTCHLKKKDGLLTLYDYIQKHNDLPPLQELYYMVHLEKTEVRLIKDMILKRFRRWGLWKN
jgi:hypothetical protein